MKKIEEIKTTTYDAGDGWKVDITEMPGKYEAFLYPENCGVKMLMFSWPTEQNDGHWTVERFIDLVEGNLPEYIATYKNEYMDEE